MTFVFDSLSRSTIPRSLRGAQALACLSVACATLNVARESTTPAMVSLTQQLEVRRTDEGFQATVLANPVQTQTSLAHAVIDSSLSESAPVPTT